MMQNKFLMDFLYAYFEIVDKKFITGLNKYYENNQFSKFDDYFDVVKIEDDFKSKSRKKLIFEDFDSAKAAGKQNLIFENFNLVDLLYLDSQYQFRFQIMSKGGVRETLFSVDSTYCFYYESNEVKIYDFKQILKISGGMEILFLKEYSYPFLNLLSKQKLTQWEHEFGLFLNSETLNCIKFITQNELELFYDYYRHKKML